MEKTKARITDSASASILSRLQFSAERPQGKADQQQREPRMIVLESIDHQIKLLEADLNGTEYLVSKTRFAKDENGNSAKTTVSVAPRRAYFERGGQFYATVRYGNQLLEMVEGHPSIAAGKSLADVLSTYQTIREAVAQGEVDAAIERAAAAMKRKKEATAA